MSERDPRPIHPIPLGPHPIRGRKRVVLSRYMGVQSLMCPICGHDKLHQREVEVYQRTKEDSEAGGAWGHVNAGQSVVLPMARNPSWRRDGIRIGFECESCDLDARVSKFALLIYQHKGETIFEWEEWA